MIKFPLHLPAWVPIGGFVEADSENGPDDDDDDVDDNNGPDVAGSGRSSYYPQSKAGLVMAIAVTGDKLKLCLSFVFAQMKILSRGDVGQDKNRKCAIVKESSKYH